MAASTSDPEGHLVAGDGLRALAALAVLAFHGFLGVAVLLAARGRETDWGALDDLLVRLNCGLYVFFALSGYLVGGPWVRAWLRGGGFPAPGAYLVRRARRIVPAFWVVGAVLLLWFGTWGAGPRDVGVLLLFGQVLLEGPVAHVLPQGWTLDVEAMFYVALPVLAWLVVRAHGVPADPATRRRVLLAVLAVAFAGGLALRSGAPGSLELAGARNVATFAWAFVPGLLLAALEPTARVRLAGRRAGRGVALALGAIGLGSVAALTVLHLDDGRPATLLAYAGCGGGLVGGALAWQWATGAAPPGFDTRAAHALGRWSYGIYLIHVGVGVELIRHVPQDASASGALALVLGGMLAGSIALAAALWWLVEEPVLRGRAPRLPVRRPRSAGVETPTGPSVAAVVPEAVPARAAE